MNLWPKLITFFKFLFFLIGFGLILILGYFLGFDILIGHTGNDAPNAFTFVAWIDKYFPRVPYWFPFQGAGVSFVQGYNVLSHFLVVILKRITPLSLLEVFHLFLFLSPILAAMGIYFWVWCRFKSQVMALLAGVFYLLMPLTWVFVTEWGFYAEAISYIFIAPTIAFFDFYLQRKKLWLLLLAGVFFSLTFLTHIQAGFFLAFLISFYGLFYSFLKEKGGKISRFKKGFLAVFIVGLMVLLLTAFWLVPFLSYAQVSGRGMRTGLLSREQISDLVLPIESLLGLTRIYHEDFQSPLANASAPPLLWGLALIGFLLAIFRSKKILILGLFLILESLYISSLEARFWASQQLTFLSNFLTLRSYLFSVRFILPVMAAYGLVDLVNFPFLPLKKWLRGVVPLLTGGISILIAALLIFVFATFPRLEDRLINYGPGFAGDNLKLIWEKKDLIDWRRVFNKKYFTQMKGREVRPHGQPGIISYLEEKLPKEDNLRVDFSATLGGATQTINISNHHLSQISLYTFTLCLNRPMWGYQQAVFYSQEESYLSAKPLNEVANYYGIRYAILSAGIDPAYKFQESGWELFDEKEKIQIWQNPALPELAELSSRPTVLVIGDNRKVVSYEQILRVANLGGLSWRDAYLIRGRKDIDAYSPDELKKFDVLILHGYSYKNKDKAWKLIEDYVNQGGRVLVETGWQYTAADWEMEEAPLILPFESLGWQNIGPTKDYVIAKDLKNKVKIENFDPLVWEDKGWGFSSFTPSDLRDWGEVILSVKGFPLVVRGKKGEGRIVWSGMNLPAHTIRHQNDEEVKFFHTLMTWLMGGKKIEDYSLTVDRPQPDKAGFTINQDTSEPTSLFWRESYHPHWQAMITEGTEGKLKAQREGLKVYEAGTGLMLISLPPVSPGTKVTLSYQTPVSYWLARAISLVSFIFLLILALHQGTREKLGSVLYRFKEKTVIKVKKGWEKEDY